MFNEGQSIVLTADVTSLSNVVYQWQVSYDEGITWINVIDDTINGTVIIGSNTNILTFNNLDKSFDNNAYQLVASTPSYPCGFDEPSELAILILEEIFIPDGFSPNDDSRNDTWHITGIDRFPNNHVEIYSRWEIKVFEKDGYGLSSNDEWDGTSNVNTFSIGNDKLPEGTYFYVIDLGEGNKPIKGYIYLRR
tara:strand:- start:825 stop:1403 length:579 start_codon:yes stop_codon:yes gene_type:complete